MPPILLTDPFMNNAGYDGQRKLTALFFRIRYEGKDHLSVCQRSPSRSTMYSTATV